MIVSDAIYPGTLFGTAVVPHSLLVQNNNPTQETRPKYRDTATGQLPGPRHDPDNDDRSLYKENMCMSLICIECDL